LPISQFQWWRRPLPPSQIPAGFRYASEHGIGLMVREKVWLVWREFAVDMPSRLDQNGRAGGEVYKTRLAQTDIE
jgi:hypothetical protein